MIKTKQEEKKIYLLKNDIFEINHINMDYFTNLWYSGREKEENPFITLLAATSIEEMEKAILQA